MEDDTFVSCIFSLGEGPKEFEDLMGSAGKRLRGRSRILHLEFGQAASPMVQGMVLRKNGKMKWPKRGRNSDQQEDRSIETK